MADMPQISNAPDPISQMQQISPDWGNNLSAGWAKSIDDYINGLIHRAGDIVGAGVTKMAEGAMAMGNAVTNIASSAVDPFKQGFVAVAPGGDDSPAQDGPGKTRELAAETSMAQAQSVDIGGVSQGRTMEVAQVSEARLGDISPTPVGVGQQQSQSMGLA